MKAHLSPRYVLTLAFLVASPALALDLPDRTTPVPRTTSGVPHVQIGITPVPALSEALIDRVSALPDVEIRDTVISLPGAFGFWLSDNIALARPEAIVRGREFAHLHPDGSLHASLPPELSIAAVEAGWAVAHPWANRRAGWDGFAMIFTPQNVEELEVVIELIEASYEYVTGRASP